MSLTRVQQASAANTTFASTVTATFGSNVTAGNYVIIAWEGDAPAAGNKGNTPTDNFNNTGWTRATTQWINGTFELDIWYCQIATGGASFAVTVTDSLGGADSVLIAEEWSGVAAITNILAATALDGTVITTDGGLAGGTLLTGNLVTTNANDVIWVGAVQGHTGVPTFTAGATYSNLTQKGTTFSDVAVESKTVAASGTITASMTSTVTNQSWIIAAIGLVDTAIVIPPHAKVNDKRLRPHLFSPGLAR